MENYNSIHELAKANPANPREVSETGFMDNIFQATRLSWNEDNLTGKAINEWQYTERDAEILQLNTQGVIPDDVIQMATTPLEDGGIDVDFDKVAKWVNKNTDMIIRTNDDILQNIREDLKEKREEAEDVFNRANIWGVAGQFAGHMLGMASDLAYLPLYFTGVGGYAKAATWLQRFGKTAVQVGLMEGGVEAIRQPYIYEWKNQIGVDYNFDDAVSNVITATLGAGVITGTTSAVSAGLKKLITRGAIKGNPVSETAQTYAENAAREMDRSPDKNLDARDHMSRLEGEVQRQNTRKTVADDAPEPDEVDAVFEDKAADDYDNQLEIIRRCADGTLS